MTPRDIQRWYPKRWNEIAGNSGIIQSLRDFIMNGGTNMLFTGPSRTGKTRTIALGIMAAMCSKRTPDLDPCGKCSICEQLNNAQHNLNGLFSVMADAGFSYFAIDCESVTAEELKQLKRDVSLESVTTIIYLDEVAALGRRGLDSSLLKAIDETPAIWIASAIAVRKRDGRGPLKRTPGLTDPMLARFAVKEGTALPPQPELAAWIRQRCTEWDLTIDQEDRTISWLVKRSRHRVGLVILVLAVAASRGRRLTYELVDSFDFQAAD